MCQHAHVSTSCKHIKFKLSLYEVPSQTSIPINYSFCCSLAAAEEFELADALSGDLEGLQEEMRSRNNRRKLLQGQSAAWNPVPGAKAIDSPEHTGIEESQVINRIQLPHLRVYFPNQLPLPSPSIFFFSLHFPPFLFSTISSRTINHTR